MHHHKDAHCKWQELVDQGAWEQVLDNLSAQEIGLLRRVSQSWRDDTSRALSTIHLVDPTPVQLAQAAIKFPSLRSVTVVLTHPWGEDGPACLRAHQHHVSARSAPLGLSSPSSASSSASSGLSLHSDGSTSTCDKEPSELLEELSDFAEHCSASGPGNGQQQERARTQLMCTAMSPLHLRELALHGWPGTCEACAQQSSPGAGAPDVEQVPSGSQRDGQAFQCALDVPSPLIKWAAGNGKLHTLCLSRCAAPLAPGLLQACTLLRRLHLVNVEFPTSSPATSVHAVGTHDGIPATLDGGGGTAPKLLVSPLVQALQCLAHLEVLSLLQKEPTLQASGALPVLHGLCSMPALHTFSLAGPAQLLLQVAVQVPGWVRLRSLRLESGVRYGQEVHEGELPTLLAAMQPGSSALTSFTCLGHSSVSDGCLTLLAQLFPSLQHVSLMLDEYAQDSSWNPLTVPTVPGGPLGALTPSGLQNLVSTSLTRPPLLSLHLGNVPLCVDMLSAICTIPHLRELDLSGCLRVDDSVLYRLACSRHLVLLVVSRCPAVSDIGLAHLACTAHSLQHLDVSECDRRVTDLGVTRLAMLPHLAVLNLAGCYHVTDAGLAGLLLGAHAAPHRKHSALEKLNVSGCHHITDTGLAVLSQGAPHLSHLSLNGLPTITPRGLQHLASLRHLHSVSVAWCSEKVQAASAALACHVLGHRLGPLMTVPPGKLEPVAMTLLPTEPISASHAVSGNNCSTSRAVPETVPSSQQLSGSGLRAPGQLASTAPVAVPQRLRSGGGGLSLYVGPLCMCSEVGADVRHNLAPQSCSAGGGSMTAATTTLRSSSYSPSPSQTSGAAGTGLCAGRPRTDASARTALRFKSSSQIVGFASLSDPAPRHAGACWWLPGQ